MCKYLLVSYQLMKSIHGLFENFALAFVPDLYGGAAAGRGLTAP
jgi:hypothetical protein